MGNRRVTPAMNSDLQIAVPPSEKCPMWLNEKLVTDRRLPQPRLPEWKVGAAPISTHFAQNGS